MLKRHNKHCSIEILFQFTGLSNTVAMLSSQFTRSLLLFLQGWTTPPPSPPLPSPPSSPPHSSNQGKCSKASQVLIWYTTQEPHIKGKRWQPCPVLYYLPHFLPVLFLGFILPGLKFLVHFLHFFLQILLCFCLHLDNLKRKFQKWCYSI